MADQTTSEIVTYFSRVLRWNAGPVRPGHRRIPTRQPHSWHRAPRRCGRYRRSLGSGSGAVGRWCAVDLPGFGHSNHPSRLNRRPMPLAFFVTLLNRGLDLGAPHIGGPDVGTAAPALFPWPQGHRTSHHPFRNRRRAVTFSRIRGGRRPLGRGDRGPPVLDDVRQLGLLDSHHRGFTKRATAWPTEPRRCTRTTLSAYDPWAGAAARHVFRSAPTRKQNKLVKGFLAVNFRSPTLILAGEPTTCGHGPTTSPGQNTIAKQVVAHRLHSVTFAGRRRLGEYGASRLEV